MQKRVLTIQDFSCMGRCSLTVALPTLSCCGVECVCLPTAVLSNHTMFKSWTYHDLTSEMEDIVGKWIPYDHSFDFIYTGYLSNRQIDSVKRIVLSLKEDKTRIFVDPAMADNGKLYPGFDMGHVDKMRELLPLADYIKPNLTEACLLSSIEYPNTEKGIPLSFYASLFEKLSEYGMKNIVLTGQELEENRIADIYYDCRKREMRMYETQMYPGKFHGTGDLFSSALVGALANSLSLDEGIRIAHDFLHETIKNTIDEKLDGTVYGAVFEPALKMLMLNIEKAKEKAF